MRQEKINFWWKKCPKLENYTEMKEFYMRSIMIQFYGLVINCLLTWNIISLIISFSQINKVLLGEMYYWILPLRLWKHLFLCERSKFCMEMCRNCTKLYVSKKKQTDHINDNLYVEINHFPPQILVGIAIAKKINLFANRNVVSSKKNLFSLNLGGLNYESVSSPFLL